MAHYLRFPASTGATSTNNFLVQISGITGTLSRVQWTLAENVGPCSIGRYFYDMRRLVDSTAQGSGTLSVIAQSGATSGLVTGVSNLQKNGVATNSVGIFTALADDVCSFDTVLTPSGGCIAFGGRFNETESCYGLAVYNIVITDANGVHTLNMSSSNGTINEFTSDTGQITLKLINAPVDNSQWVFYGAGGPSEFSISVTSNTLLPTSAVSLDNLPPEYSTIINSLALLPTSNVSLENTDPSYTVTVLSEALLPTTSIVLGNDKPTYSSTVASNTFLPVSVGVLSNSPPEYLISISSATLLPTSNVNLTPEAPNTSLSIFSSALLPSSVVALNSAAPSGLSVVSSALLPTSTVELDNQYVGVSTVTSNTLLPVSNIVLGATVPEDSIVVLSNAPLPTSIVLLSNGSVVYSVGNKNSLTIKPINNNVSIKTKSNFIQLR